MVIARLLFMLYNKLCPKKTNINFEKKISEINEQIYLTVKEIH